MPFSSILKNILCKNLLLQFPLMLVLASTKYIPDSLSFYGVYTFNLKLQISRDPHVRSPTAFSC